MNLFNINIPQLKMPSIKDIFSLLPNDKKSIIYLIVGLIVGAYVTYTYFPRVEYKNVVMPELAVETQIKYVDNTVVEYVPKGIIVDSNGNKVKEDTDVEINKAQPAVNVKYNDKDYKFGLQHGEVHKFDNGKLLVTQTSDIKVDVTADVQKQITAGINEAFKNHNKSVTKVGVEAVAMQGDSPEYNLRVSRQTNKVDIDLRINRDKDVGAGIVYWF